MARVLYSERVDGPQGRHVHVQFYDDDSCRVRIPDVNPLAIREAASILDRVYEWRSWMSGHDSLFLDIERWRRNHKP